MFSYAQVERILAAMYGAGEDAQRGAFRGRLKHLKRLGMPRNSQSTRGKRVSYSREQLLELALCLELEEFGLDPTVIVSLMTHFFDHLRRSMYKANETGSDYLLSLTPQLMSRSWTTGSGLFAEQFPGLLDLTVFSVSDSEFLSKHMREESRRVMLINLSSVFRSLDEEVGRVAGGA